MISNGFRICKVINVFELAPALILPIFRDNMDNLYTQVIKEDRVEKFVRARMECFCKCPSFNVDQTKEYQPGDAAVYALFLPDGRYYLGESTEILSIYKENSNKSENNEPSRWKYNKRFDQTISFIEQEAARRQIVSEKGPTNKQKEPYDRVREGENRDYIPVVEDYKIRKYLKTSLYSAGIAKIEIERDNAEVKILLYCSRPGVIIGKGGQEIENIRQKVADMTGKNVILNIIEVRSPDLNAQLVAEKIAAQIEKRISFRRAMKQATQRATRLGAKGIKCMCAGRLGGAEIARSETYHEGTIPLQTVRGNIEYGFAEANTTHGKVGCKVWIYKGELLNSTLPATAAPLHARRIDRSIRHKSPTRIKKAKV